MTKEQEAIKNIKICIHDYISESVDEYGYTIYKISEEEQEFFENIETVLNMLKEKDKEIEDNKKSLDNLENELNRLSVRNLQLFEESFEAQKKNDYWRNRIEQGKKDVKGLKTYEIGIVCEDLKEEIKMKEKQIDLMAEHIVNSAIVDDTVCAIKCDCETDIREECTYEKMLNCTKQYFERKATKLSARKEK